MSTLSLLIFSLKSRLSLKHLSPPFLYSYRFFLRLKLILIRHEVGWRGRGSGDHPVVNYLDKQNILADTLNRLQARL